MSYTLHAMVAKSAPEESFPTACNSEYGWWVYYLTGKYADHESVIWSSDIQEIYTGLCKDLDNEESREELLKDLRVHDEEVTLQDLERIRDFLKVCIDNEYILSEWY